MSTNDIQNGWTPIADNCAPLRTKSGQNEWVNTLQWVHDRLVNIHRENPAVDYMRKFRETIADIADCLVTPPAPVEVNSGQGKIDELVGRFLSWRLPETVRVDRIAYEPAAHFDRYGTNLLTASEARQMIVHLLMPMQSVEVKPAPETITVGQAMGKSMDHPDHTTPVLEPVEAASQTPETDEPNDLAGAIGGFIDGQKARIADLELELAAAQETIANQRKQLARLNTLQTRNQRERRLQEEAHKARHYHHIVREVRKILNVGEQETAIDAAMRVRAERDEARKQLRWKQHRVEVLQRVGRKIVAERDEARATIADVCRALEAFEHEGPRLAAMRVRAERDEITSALEAVAATQTGKTMSLQEWANYQIERRNKMGNAPTPMTDEEYYRSCGSGHYGQSVPIDFARDLERQLAEAREQRDKLSSLLKRATHYVHTCPFKREIIDALAAVKE